MVLTLARRQAGPLAGASQSHSAAARKKFVLFSGRLTLQTHGAGAPPAPGSAPAEVVLPASPAGAAALGPTASASVWRLPESRASV